MAKLKEQWAKYISTVPGFEAAVDPPVRACEDSDVEYDSLVNSMPSDIGSDLSEAADNQLDELHWEKTVEHHWCLCEMPEGDFPRVFAFPSLQRLAEAIAKREGQETAVWPMYGVPLRMTKSVPSSKKDGARTRYLLLPNQLAAVVSADEPYRLIDQSLLLDGLEMQDEGWLGDPVMLQDQSYYMQGVVDSDDVDEGSYGTEDDDEDLDYIE